MAKITGTAARSVAETGGHSSTLPKTPATPEQRGIPAQVLAKRIDEFLASRGYRAPAADGVKESPDPQSDRSVGRTSDLPAEFICEDDVRTALSAGRKLLIGEKTIITPSARDLGESGKVFVQASWPN
jgi:hypothetical protein